MKRALLIALYLVLICQASNAQRRWNMRPDVATADTILAYQFPSTLEINYLLAAYKQFREERFRQGALRGIRYLLAMQYDNGGWPQFWPARHAGYDNVKAYAHFITFNDNAMVNAMRVLRNVAEDKEPYTLLEASQALKDSCQRAFDKGIECILRCQIVTDGKLTVWCQQHNDKTLAPEHARAYELPSYCSAESASIVELLMSLPNPDQKVIKAVDAAMEWFEKTKIMGLRTNFTRKADGKWQRDIIEDPNAGPLWARFYDLKNCEPFFCDRDGIPRKKLSEIGDERRNGYGWYNDNAAKLFREYEVWKAKL